MGEVPPGAAVRHADGFFARGALLIAAFVLLSFVSTYFLPMATRSKDFTLLRHLHGIAFFAWIALYVVQTHLVRRGGMRLHRELGIAGAALAGAMLVLGVWQAVSAVSERMAGGAELPFEFALYNLVDILVFSLAFGWAIVEAPRRIEWHRRLMFVAALNLLGPAVSRLTPFLQLDFPWSDMAPNLVADAWLLALALHDRRTLGRIHPVTVWAALLLVPFHAVEPFIARSGSWNAIAPFVFGFG